jgi:para-nitrobenzyl esterase
MHAAKDYLHYVNTWLAPVASAVALIIGGVAAQSASSGDDSKLIATTAEGKVKGISDEGVVKFLGIPYAASPVGSLRWKAPIKPQKYVGVYDASFARSECMQGSQANPAGSEDCLYLNIVRPVSPKGAVNRAPVIVWIHGGGYTSGSGISYDLAPLARAEGVVTVSLNYRLGSFGFLAHPALSEEEKPQRSGNYGILDMQMALAWVKANISAFGGDPSNVTIVGESAGGAAVFTLLASPKSVGLFAKAVPQSGGGPDRRPLTLDAAEAAGRTVAETKYGCVDEELSPAAQPVVANCLRSLSPAVILSGVMIGAVIDKEVLTEATADAFANGRFNRVPVMTGTTHDEGTFFVARLGANAQNYAALGQLDMPSADVMKQYPLANYPTPAQALATAWGDSVMVCATLSNADGISQYLPATYVYNWGPADPASPASFVQGYPGKSPDLEMRAAHAMDVTYWFGLILPKESTPERIKLSATMMRYLANFARTADPNGGDAPVWQKYTASHRQAIQLASPINPAYDAFNEHHCDFWYKARF